MPVEQSQQTAEQSQHTLPFGKDVNFPKTILNGLNTLAGLGILSIPYALSSGGWLTLSLFLLIATICCYTGVLLKRCMDRSIVETYEDVGKHAFGRIGKILVATFVYLELYLISIEFLVLEGDNLEKLFPIKNWGLLGLKHLGGKEGFVLLAALVVLMLTTWTRNLGRLAYVSLVGVLAFVVLVVCVLWSGAFDGVGFHERGKLLDLGGIPTAVSLYVFCYGGHAVFPTIYTSMRDRNQFRKVLMVCFALCTLCFGSVAVMGYMMFGQNVSSQITLNLPTEKMSSKIAIYTTVIPPLTKYALVITPVVEFLEKRFHVSANSWLISVMIRTLLVISTTIFALYVPFFGYLTALTGSLLTTTASVLLPCLCYLKIFWRSEELDNSEKVVVIGIVVLGVLTAITGTYISFKQLIGSF